MTSSWGISFFCSFIFSLIMFHFDSSCPFHPFVGFYIPTCLLLSSVYTSSFSLIFFPFVMNLFLPKWNLKPITYCMICNQVCCFLLQYPYLEARGTIPEALKKALIAFESVSTFLVFTFARRGFNKDGLKRFLGIRAKANVKRYFFFDLCRSLM